VEISEKWHWCDVAESNSWNLIMCPELLPQGERRERSESVRTNFSQQNKDILID
jgi:hypothetical protein